MWFAMKVSEYNFTWNTAKILPASPIITICEHYHLNSVFCSVGVKGCVLTFVI